jgi:electron transfer flavoprotein beta subunit
VTRIIVAVKYVPDAAARTFDEADLTVDRENGSGLLSELDEYPVEQALRIVETGQGDPGEVTALTVGPPAAADAVRKALQMGADAGVHVVDDAIGGSDVFATSLVLAAAIGRLEYDLIIFGMASTDGGLGVVPTLVAEHLGIPALTYASDVAMDGSRVRIRRDGDAATQRIEAAGPLVLSVTDQIAEPRYPSFKGIMAAKKKRLEQWSLADLGIDADHVGLAASWTRVECLTARPPRAIGQIVTDEGNAGLQLVEFLAGRKLVSRGA